MPDRAKRARGMRIAPAQREQRCEGERVIRHEEEGEHCDHLLEPTGDDEGHRREAAQEQRDVRRPAFVDFTRAAPEQAVPAHGEKNARRHQDVRVDGADHGHDRQGSQHRIAIHSEEMLGHDSGGQFLSGQRRKRHDAQKGDVQQQIDTHHGEDPAEHGSRNVPRWLLHLLGEVDHRGPAVVGVDHGLQREDVGQQQRSFAFRLHRCRRRIAIAEVETGGDQKEEGQRLQRAGDVLRPTAPANPHPLHEREDGDHRQRHDLHRAQMRHEVNGVFADDDGHGGGRAAGGDPVAPPDDEAGVIAEGVADEDVLPAGARKECAQLRQRIGAQQRV